MGGRLLAELRVGADLTQEEVAEKIGVSRSALAKWESNTRTPRGPNLRKLLDCYGASREQRVEVSTALLGAA